MNVVCVVEDTAKEVIRRGVDLSPAGCCALANMLLGAVALLEASLDMTDCIRSEKRRMRPKARWWLPGSVDR